MNQRPAMLLTIHGLPSHVKYHDLKVLVRQECNLNDYLLDDLNSDGGNTKKVRISVADESARAHLIKCLDGFRMAGQVLRVVPVGKAMGNPQHDHGNNYFQRNDYRSDGPSYNGPAMSSNQSGPLSRPVVMPGRPLPRPGNHLEFQSHLASSMQSHLDSMTSNPGSHMHQLQSYPDMRFKRDQSGPLNRLSPIPVQADPMSHKNVQVHPVSGQPRGNVWEQRSQWENLSQARPQSQSIYQYQAREENAPLGRQNKVPQDKPFQIQTPAYNNPGFDRKYQDSDPEPKRQKPDVSGEYVTEPRFSPRRDVGRRESQDNRRVESSPRRDKPPSTYPYGDSWTPIKDVRPAYEARTQVPKQTFYTGGYHPSINDDVTFPIVGRSQEHWQEGDRILSGNKSDDRRDLRPKFDEDWEPKDRSVHESRSQLRRHVIDRSPPRDRFTKRSVSPRLRHHPLDRSPPRDRFTKHSMSPRSPRRSWALEKRPSPEHAAAPPPPLWPGSPQDDQYKRNLLNDNRNPKWDRPSFNEQLEHERRTDIPEKRRDTEIRVRSDLGRTGILDAMHVSPRDTVPHDRSGDCFSAKESVFLPREPNFEIQREFEYIQSGNLKEPNFKLRSEAKEPKFEPRREPNFEPRVEPTDIKFEPRREPKFKPRGESKFEPRGESKFEPRGESKFEPRGESKFEPRGIPKFEPKGESKFEPRMEPRGLKFEPRVETRDLKFEPRREPRFEPRREHAFETRDTGFDTRLDPKFEYRRESHVEPKFEPRREPLFEPKETKVVLRREPVFESRNPNFELKRVPHYEPRADSNFERAREPQFEPINTHLESRRDPQFEHRQTIFEQRADESEPKLKLSRFIQRPADGKARQDIEHRLAELKNISQRYDNRYPPRDVDKSESMLQSGADRPDKRLEMDDILLLSKKPKSDFNKDFDDVYKRTLEFKQKVEAMRRNGDKKREESVEKKPDKKLQRDDERQRDLSRPYDRRQEYKPEDPKRNHGKEVAEIKSKRDKAVEEISKKILLKHSSKLELSPSQSMRLLEELKIALVKIFQHMFHNQDVSFIEMVVKFNARFGDRSEAELFEDVFNRLPSSFRKRHVPEIRDDPEVPAKASRMSTDDNMKAVPDWSMKTDQQQLAAIVQQFDIVPHVALQKVVGMPSVVPMLPVPINSAMVSLRQPLLHQSPMQQQIMQPITQPPVMPLALLAANHKMVKDQPKTIFDKPYEEKQSGYFNLYLCKDDFEPYSTTQAEYLKKFLVNQIIAASESSSGWTPDFTLKGLQSLYRYELVARDDNTRDWILKLDFSDFSFFNVLVYTKEELWYERAAIWLPGHSKYRTIEPLQKLKLQNSHMGGVNIGKWKMVKKIENAKGTRIYVDMPPSSARALEKQNMSLSYELQKVSVFLKAVAVDKETFDIGLKESSVNDENVIKTAINNSPMPSLGPDPNIVKISLKGNKALNVDQARKIKERLIYHIFKYHQNKRCRKTDFVKFGFCLPGSFGVLPENSETRRWLEHLDLGKLYKHAIVVLGSEDSTTKFISMNVVLKRGARDVINHALILERLKISNQGIKGLNFHMWKYLRCHITKDYKVNLAIDMDVESVDTLAKFRYKLDYIDEYQHQQTAVVSYVRSYTELEELVKKYKSELTDSYDVANMELDSDPDDE